MTVYRLMDGVAGRPGTGSTGTQPPSAPSAYAGNFLAGTLFSSIGVMGWLQGYWFWCPPGGDTGAQKFALWNRYSASAQNLVPGSVAVSGALTAGAWNYVPLGTPVQLGADGLYVAATGWVSVNGFPDSQNQFGAAQPYAAGITNGPLTAWSDAAGGGTNNWLGAATASWGLSQGLFSSALGSDPSVNMPNAGSASSNFWVDVAVSDTAPAGYSGSYRVWPNKADLGNYSLDTANQFTLGMEFILSQACTVSRIWFYSPATVTILPAAIGVYQVSTAALVTNTSSPSWSGAAGSGWVSAPLTGTLQAGTKYKAAVFGGDNASAWNAAVANYFSTGYGGSGLTAGPVSVYSGAAADAPGQETYNLGPALAYPGTNAGPYAYGVDIEVTPAAPQYAYSMRSMP